MTVEAPIREFVEWPKIPRLNREIIITEKLDGTNAAVVVTTEGDVYAQSRTRIITPDEDNHGFARWVHDNADDLREQLGEGRHFGEWWGRGIQKRYSAHIDEKRFSLFNTLRWTAGEGYRCNEAPLCHVVPVIAAYGSLDAELVNGEVEQLRKYGSLACPGAAAEGVVVYHKQGHLSFKVTLEKDGQWKGAS